MFRNKLLLTILAVMLVFGMSFTSFADPVVVPGGPFMSGNEPPLLDAFSSYEQLSRTLEGIERRSRGTMELSVIGESNEGRNIYMAKIGDGDIPVFIHTQQHGNEPHGTEAALQIIQDLAMSGNPTFREIRENLTVYIVPRVNPDGHEVYWRFNVDPDAPPRSISEGFWTAAAGGGWDINRYHWIDWTNSDLYANHPQDYPENPVPEAQALVDAFLDTEPIWIVDWHNQGSYVSPDGKNVTSSIMWPNHPDVPEDAVDLSKQLSVAMMDEMNQYGFSEVTRYPGSAIPNIARNAYGLEGVGSVLVEIRGGIDQKSSGMLVKHSYHMMKVMLQQTADGSLFEIDGSRIDTELPERGSWIPSTGPNEEELEEAIE